MIFLQMVTIERPIAQLALLSVDKTKDGIDPYPDWDVPSDGVRNNE